MGCPDPEKYQLRRHTHAVTLQQGALLQLCCSSVAALLQHAVTLQQSSLATEPPCSVAALLQQSLLALLQLWCSPVAACCHPATELPCNRAPLLCCSSVEGGSVAALLQLCCSIVTYAIVYQRASLRAHTLVA